MGVKVRERDGAWWLFIDHNGKRKAKRVGEGKQGKKAAELAATKIAARLAEGGPIALEPPTPTPDAPTLRPSRKSGFTSTPRSMLSARPRSTTTALSRCATSFLLSDTYPSRT